MKDLEVTVYTGPAQERLVNNQLRGQGATYFLNRILLLIFIVRKKASILYVILALVARVWNWYLLMAVLMRCGVIKKMRLYFPL